MDEANGGKTARRVYCTAVDSFGGAMPQVWLDYALASAERVLPGSEWYVMSDSDRDFGHGAKTINISKLAAEVGLDETVSGPKLHGSAPTIGVKSRLLVPLLPQFDGALVAYVDADVEIADARFARVFDMLEPGREVAMAEEPCASSSKYAKNILARNIRRFPWARKEAAARLSAGRYLAAGTMVFDVEAVRRNHPGYAADVAPMYRSLARVLRLGDQDFSQMYFDVCALPVQFGMHPCVHRRGAPAWLLHYAGAAKYNESEPYPQGLYRPMRDAVLAANAACAD